MKRLPAVPLVLLDREPARRAFPGNTMNRNHASLFPVGALATLLVAAAGIAHAQSSPGTQDGPTGSRVLQPAGADVGAISAAPAPLRGVEAYASHRELTAGFPEWRELGLRISYQLGANVVRGEVASMKRWNESGVYAGIGDTYTLDPDWYASVNVGAGDGASYLPRYRIDAFLHRKLLAQRNLVANLGVGYYRAPDGHVDRNVSVGATYYVQAHPLVLQGEVRFTHGSPGSVDTRQQFVAATWGRQKQTTVTVRYGWGEEGYQSIGGDAVLTNFRSRELSASVRRWLGIDWGVELAGEQYRNPTYRRSGLTGGLFWLTP